MNYTGKKYIQYVIRIWRIVNWPGLSGNGVDVTSILNNSVISRGGYYYYYNTTEGRFGKYQLVNGAVSSVKQVPLPTFMDLGNGNAILKYIETTVNNESTYGYAIINLANGMQVRKLTEVPFGGSGEKNVLVEDGKAYIAVLSGTAKDYIWVYDAATDKVTRGTQIQGGYNSFSRLDKMN